MVGAIVVLSLTGYWLHHPFFAPAPPVPGADPGSTLATVRFVHELAGVALIAALLVRVYWAFAGNRYARFTALLPLTPEQRRQLRETLSYYLLRRGPPHEVGHNPLAGMSYILLWLGFLGAILTGLDLYAWLLRAEPWTTIFGWWWKLIPIQDVRLIHFILMWLILAFAVHHIYSAVLFDREMRNGEISSIITGWKADYGEEDDR
jgi:Ni/Fe-hydrogenase 1 B-type cytochrome subunit